MNQAELIESIAKNLGNEKISFEGKDHTPAEIIILAIACLDFATKGDRQPLDKLLLGVPKLIAQIGSERQTPMTLIRAGMESKTLIVAQPAETPTAPPPTSTQTELPTANQEVKQTKSILVGTDGQILISKIEDIALVNNPDDVTTVHLGQSALSFNALDRILRKFSKTTVVTVSPSLFEEFENSPEKSSLLHERRIRLTMRRKKPPTPKKQLVG